MTLVRAATYAALLAEVWVIACRWHDRAVERELRAMCDAGAAS